jgi:hypothetical protein
MLLGFSAKGMRHVQLTLDAVTPMGLKGEL